MRILLSLCTLAVLLLLFIISSMPKKMGVEDLTGHWHVVQVTSGSEYEIGILEISRDTSVISLYRNEVYNQGRLSNYLDTLHVQFGHNFDVFHLEELDGDRLNVEWIGHPDVALYLQRFTVNNEHLRNDFFADDRLRIHLPKDSLEAYSTEVYKRDILDVYLGSRALGRVDRDQAFIMKQGDKISDLLDPEDVWLYLEQMRVKMPELIRPLVKPTIYCDAATPRELLEDFQQLYAALGYDTVFRAYEIPAGPDDFQLSYESITADELPDSVVFIAKPSQLLCLGTNDNTNFTLGVESPDDSQRLLPDSMGYGYYHFFPASDTAFQLQVAFNGPGDLWRADHQGQYFVSAKFESPVYRLWNGLQVGELEDRYAHLQFVRSGHQLVREETRFSYVLTTGDAGRITSVEVFSNYFWQDKGASGIDTPWMPHLQDRQDCRLRIW